MPSGEAGVSLWAAVSGNYFLGTPPWKKGNFGSHCTFTWAFRDNPSFIISFNCPSSENVLCSVGKDQEASTAHTGLTWLPDQIHMWNSSKKESSAQRKGDRGFWLCEVGHHSGSACSQGVRTTYISSPCRMFDVISGTTPGLNITKIDLLV